VTQSIREWIHGGRRRGKVAAEEAPEPES